MFEPKNGTIFGQANKSLKYFNALTTILSNFSSFEVEVQTLQISLEKS